MTDRRLFELHAEVCKVLANPWRLELIDLLRSGERSLRELVEKLGVPVANVSQHLNIMRGRGIVAVRREGSRSFYRLTDPDIVKAFDIMRGILRKQLVATGALAGAIPRSRTRGRSR